MFKVLIFNILIFNVQQKIFYRFKKIGFMKVVFAQIKWK